MQLSGLNVMMTMERTSWSQQAKLVASDGAADDYFGYSVSISGYHAVIGAYLDDDRGNSSGSVYVFNRNGAIWSEQLKLNASDGTAEDRFGWSVSISGDYAVVGAIGDNSYSGSAYIYGEFYSYICGAKWHDSDGDSEYDDDEQVIEGWRIYIDEDENGQFDAGEPNDITDSNGNYVLMVPAGSHVVAEEAKSCWEQTCPGGEGTYTVNVGQDEVINRSFGNAFLSEAHKSAWRGQQQAKLVASDGDASDEYGRSVSVSGDYAIAGAHFDDDNGYNSGSAYIFVMNDVNCSEWDEAAKLTASDGDAGDYFGRSVFINGNYVIAGAYGDEDNGSNSGSAYIFRRDGEYWSEQAKLTALDGSSGDWFGYSVSISGDYAIVGAYRNDSNGSDSGSAYIFKRDGTNWSEQAKLTASDGAADDYFGYSVSISGDYAIVGAYGDDDADDITGSAYIFRRDGISWNEQAKLTASDGFGNDYFGQSVSISGNHAIVGAKGNDDYGEESGSAYIFKRDGAIWSEQVKLTAADGAAYDSFGYSVSIGGSYILAGAYGDDDNGNDSGSVYVFGKVLCPASDLNGDCFVDFKDVAILAGEWLTGGEEL
jgi:hypothetical protein